MNVYFFEPTCVVADDPGEVIRHARPITPEDINVIREQNIQRMMAEHQKLNRPR